MEASLTGGGAAWASGVLDRLERGFGPEELSLLARDGRCSVLVRVVATSAADALVRASARWDDAARAVELPQWQLARAEVVTVEEFDREHAGNSGRQLGAGSGGGRARAGAGIDDERDERSRELRAHERLADELLAEELLARALRDSLTGLVSRELFTDRVRSVLADEPSVVDEWVVFDVDLDHFGALNRTGGAAVADRILAVLAARICEVPEHALVARFGGDEFAVLLHSKVPGQADEAAARLLDIVRAPVQVEGRRFAVTASVGIASRAQMTYPDDLVREARVAMCHAKADGGNCARRIDPGVSVDVRRIDFDSDPAPDRWANVLLLERAALAANECQTLEDAAAIVLQQVCAHTGWPLGHLNLASDTGDCMEPTAIWYTGGPDRFHEFRAACEATSLRAGEGAAGRVLQTAQVACIADMTSARSFPAAVASAGGAVGITTAAAFPILVGRDVVAALEFFGSGERRVSDSLRDIMHGVCAQLGRVAERSRAQSALARSEERYRTLADSVPVLLWMTGPNGRSTTFNREWQEFTGRGNGEEARDCWIACVHPDDAERCDEAFQTAIAGRQPFQLDYRLRRADGEYRVISGCGRPIGEGDDFHGYVGAGVDVTDRRRAEAAVRDSEARFRALLANCGAMVTLLGADGTVIADYQGGTEGMGYPEGSATGRLGFEFLHPDDRQAAIDAFAVCLTSPGVSVPFQCRVRHADGPWRWVDAVGTNRLDYPPVGAIIISAVDISQRKALERRLAAAERRYRQTADLAAIGLAGLEAFVGEGSLAD